MSIPKRFDNYDRVAIVTGSDSGIGEAVAIALADAGFDVGITFHTDEAGAKVTAEKVTATGRRCEVRRVDFAQLPDAATVVDDLAEALGGLGVAAAGSSTSPASTSTPHGSGRVPTAPRRAALAC